MAQATIYSCGTTITEAILTGQTRIECAGQSGQGAIGNNPIPLTITEYCAAFDCSAVQSEEPTGETGLAVGLTQEDFNAIWPSALLILVIAFTVKVIRKTIYARV